MAMFRNNGTFPTGTNPVSNATADLNGDGHLDLLFTNYISDNVSVLLGDGDGGFTAAAPVAVGNGPREIVVGKLDGDADFDFINANYSGNSVTVLLNNGSATFAPATGSPVAVGTVPREVAVGDLDGDGDRDFVAGNYQSNNLSVMLNDGSGTFTQAAGSPIAVGTRPVGLVLGRFDGDDDLDIAVANNSNNSVSILLNNGSAGFAPASGSPVTVGAGPRGLARGDLDGDGDTDLAVANFGANTLSILLNDGSAGFSPAGGSPLVTGNNPYNVAIGDLDGDGDLDIAVSNSGSSSVSVFINNGSAGFTTADGGPFAVGVSPGGVVMGDFDEDGDLDLSTSNFGSNSTTILINTSFLLIRGTNGGDRVDASNTVDGERLPSASENLIKGRGGGDRLSGLGGDDAILGGKGNDILRGGPGSDSLSGGFGKDKLFGGDDGDSFVFDTALGGGKEGSGKHSSYAKIFDLTGGDDTIELAQDVFKKLDPGVLLDGAFRDIGEPAIDGPCIVYRENGELTYDKDGKGGADAIVFAKLVGTPDIDASDFLVLV